MRVGSRGDTELSRVRPSARSQSELSAEPKADGYSSRDPSRHHPGPPPSASSPSPGYRAASPPGAEGSMLAVGCALLAALLAAPAVALVLGSCRPLGKTTWIGQRGM